MSVKPIPYPINHTPALSIIIPVGPHDHEWCELLYDLEQTPEGSEIILVFSEKAQCPEPELLSQKYNLSKQSYHVMTSPQGRAFQLNNGALRARGEFLWFLHADSRFHSTTLSGLTRLLSQRTKNALFYFSLRFLADGPIFTKLNEVGARLRSRLGLPFGDQGFIIARDLFWELEGFPHDITWGEDHAFVWRCHVSGIPVKPIGTALYTSARAYKLNGWVQTSLRYVSATIRQMRSFSKDARAWYVRSGFRKDPTSEEVRSYKKVDVQ